jgi:O-glycosyl hydrolase
MKKIFTLIIISAGMLFLFSTNLIGQEISLQIDASRKFQRIDGIGVNANTRSWNGDELKPALRLLLDSMHATVWRVIVETAEKWEEENDNNDPFSFNWEYYNRLYETPKFQKAWDMIAYLNHMGVTNNLMINFMGAVPEWMGKRTIKPGLEDEYVEMIVSFFYYAKNKRRLQFGLISPTNESDLIIPNHSEGPSLNENQYAVLLRKLIDRMAAMGMGEIQLVAPDVANMVDGVKKYIPELMKDSVIMRKTAYLGLHSYGGYYANVDSLIKKSAYPGKSFWMTEWNAWCNGCDDGILGEYNYDFAAKCIGYLFDILQNGAAAAFVWEGYDSYYEHHADVPVPFSYWGMLAYEPVSNTYSPRKNFYAIQQVSKFVTPGSWRIAVSEPGDSLVVLAFYDDSSRRVSIVGINKKNSPVTINGSLANLPAIDKFEMHYTNSDKNMYKNPDIKMMGKVFKTVIPSNCIFTLTGIASERKKISSTGIKPEPAGWYAGDIHVHKNCGDGTAILPEDELPAMMEVNDLAVISLLADMGNGEVKDSNKDLPKVNGKDATQAKPGRIIHWDAEWHWDATYSDFNHQALGGHLVLLGLREAHQIWNQSPYKILEWSKKQNAISGFCHFQYLNDSIQNELNCCIPVDYPVEAALGTVDFVSEDVYGNISANDGNFNSEAAINAYYKLLNCGFRPGLAAGTDYPCNIYEPLGTLLTYVNVRGRKLTYRKWIEGIKNGKTVVSRNGHDEFLNLKVNGKYGPGDRIEVKNKGSVAIEVKWTAARELKGRIELVSNGKVIASEPGTAKPGEPVILKAAKEFAESSWVSARRMDEKGHQTHTAPVYISVDKKPVRASAEDAIFFIKWIDNILANIEPGGKWNKYFPDNLNEVKQRYILARTVFKKIENECKKTNSAN